jgi:hypothetical protein
MFHLLEPEALVVASRFMQVVRNRLAPQAHGDF